MNFRRSETPEATKKPAQSVPIKLAPLTAIRFFAALYVVLYHTYPARKADDIFSTIVSYGNISVGFFFVLSGYIIAYVYDVEKVSDTSSIRRFLIARFARIYPMYILSIVSDIPRLLSSRIVQHGIVFASGLTGLTFLLQAFMLQAWLPLGALNFPSWSLSTEVFFYATYPMILPLCRRAIERFGVMPCLCACWLISQIVPIIASGVTETRPILLGILSYNPILRVPEFIAGVLLCLNLTDDKPKSVSLLRVLLLGSIVVIFYICLFALTTRVPPLMVENGLFMPVFLGIIFLLVGMRHQSRFTIVRVLFFLGEASYCVYLLHIPIYYAMAEAARTTFGYLLFLAILIGVSAICFQYIETPLRRFILHRFRDRSTNVQPTAS